MKYIRTKDEALKSYDNYDNLIINCEHIYLNQTSIDLKIEIPNEKIEQFDYLIINGIKFKKDKSE